MDQFRNAFDKAAQHERKRHAVLDHASQLFNRKGYTGTTLDDVAERMGLTKAALYYYVKGKEDLGVQAFRRTLENQRRILDRADLIGRNGLEKIVELCRATCDSTNPPAAIMNEAAALKPANQARLEKFARDNSLLLRGFVSLGMEDGSIRPCDPVLVALTINGALSWIPQWFFRSSDRRVENVGEAFAGMLVNGLRSSAGGKRALTALSVGRGQNERHVIFDRAEQARSKRDALLRAATEIFNRKGVSGTTLDDVVQSLNVTKGAFYYYVKSKDDLLNRCYERGFDLLIELYDKIASSGLSGWEMIELAIRSTIELHCGPVGPIAIFTGISSLSPSARAEIAARARAVDTAFLGFVETGIADGSIRDCNPLFVYGNVVGSMVWIPKWYSPDGPRTPHQIANAFCDLFADGLKAD